MIWRPALAATAVVVCAWFALGLHQARDTTRAAALVAGPARLTPRQADHARSAIDSAAALNPDLTPTILRAQLAAKQGSLPEAERILESATRDEPMNIQGWFALAYVAARDGDRQTLIRAGRHISSLYATVR